jgi:hypothetical protein
VPAVKLYLYFSEGQNCKSYYSSYTFFLTVCQPNAPPNGLAMRSRPYRNDRIINVIRSMYFGGGALSFARRFCYLFPTHAGHDGDINLEVPVPMVALVATAVSHGGLFLAMDRTHQALAVCGALRVAYWRTASHRVLSKCIPGRIPRPCQHIGVYSAEVRRCFSPHDGRCLYTGEVRFNFIKCALQS